MDAFPFDLEKKKSNILNMAKKSLYDLTPPYWPLQYYQICQVPSPWKLNSGSSPCQDMPS